MNSIFINEYNYVCELIISDDKFFNRLKVSDFWEVYCPDISFSTKKIDLKPNLKIFVGNDFSKLHFDIKDRVEVPLKKLSISDIITIVDYIYEPQRNMQGIYTLNSSSVFNKDSKGVIFFGGATGMGKTSLARYLDSKQDFAIFSDDKTLLNIHTLQVIGGPNYLYINKSNLSKEFDLDENTQLRFNREDKNNIKLSLFVYGYIQKGFKERSIWSKDKFFWHIYESLTKRVRGVSRRIADGRIALPSIDTTDLSDKRIKDIDHLCSNLDCVFIKGNKKYIYKYIKDLIK